MIFHTIPTRSREYAKNHQRPVSQKTKKNFRSENTEDYQALVSHARKRGFPIQMNIGITPCNNNTTFPQSFLSLYLRHCGIIWSRNTHTSSFIIDSELHLELCGVRFSSFLSLHNWPTKHRSAIRSRRSYRWWLIESYSCNSIHHIREPMYICPRIRMYFCQHTT